MPRQHALVTTDAMCFYRNNHHDAIVLCPRLTHRYAITMNTSSRCLLTHALTTRLDRQHGFSYAMLSIETIIMLSSMTHHLVISTDTSPHRHVSQMRSSLRCRLTHTHLMLSSSCDLDWHIVMLSQMRSSLRCRLTQTPLTRVARRPDSKCHVLLSKNHHAFIILTSTDSD
jgi:hypothetical protein